MVVTTAFLEHLRWSGVVFLGVNAQDLSLLKQLARFLKLTLLVQLEPLSVTARDAESEGAGGSVVYAGTRGQGLRDVVAVVVFDEVVDLTANNAVEDGFGFGHVGRHQNLPTRKIEMERVKG